jgi:hypothetical protein
MYESALKQLIEGVAKGEYRRELFLFEEGRYLDLFKLELQDSASEAGLCPIVNTITRSIMFDGHPKSCVILAVAHPKISYRFAGIPWTAIHGLDTLDKYPEHAEGDKARLRNGWFNDTV